MGAKSGDAWMRKYVGNSKVFFLTSALTGIVVSPLHAQTMTSKEFHISAQSLPAALTQFGRQAGLQVSVPASLAEGKTSHAVNGTMSPSQSLAQILSGTGLTYHVNGNVVTLVPAAANITLGPVRVGGMLGKESATGPGVGYVAHYTESGTKTATPLWEIPNSIYVITKQQLQDQQPQNIMEALRYMPGVYGDAGGTGEDGSLTVDGQGAGTGSAVKIRGFAASQFVDGLNTRSLSAGETAFVERVESINGPASVLYGQTGAGGLIATRLKQPTDTPIHNVSVGFGNWGRYEATLDMGGNITKSGNLQYRIAAMGVTQGTQTDYINYKRVGVMPSTKWKVDENTSLVLLGSYLYTPDTGLYWTGYPLLGTLSPNNGRYIPRSRNLGEPGVDYQTATDAEFEYQFSHKFNKFLNFEQTFRYSDSSRHYNQFYEAGLLSDQETFERNAWNSRVTTKTVGLDSRVVGQFATGPVKQTLVAGMDFRYIDYTRSLGYDFNYYPIDIWNPAYGSAHPDYDLYGANQGNVSTPSQNGTYFQKGVYFQDQIKWGRLSVLLGGRQDWATGNTNSYAGNNYSKIVPVHLSNVSGYNNSKFTWRAGFTYNFKFGLTPYFSYATSFLPQEGVTNYYGKQLAPLEGNQFEAGLKYFIPHTDVFLTAAAYHIKERHYAITDTEHPNYNTDAGTVVSKGVEVSAHANITKDIRLVASYSYDDARVVKSDTSETVRDVYGNNLGKVSEKGKYIAAVPRNMVNMFIDYTLPREIFHGLGINFGVRYIGSTYADNANSFKAPPFTLFDIGAHYDFSNISQTLKGLRAQLAMSNLTDKRYVTSCTGASLAYATCSYGQARRVYGNISYSW